ncbi:glycosyltransferase [Pontiellaceae bacterium B1224]|nr:glycosyltransferase [Pontiellaceae bacterium B1224]
MKILYYGYPVSTFGAPHQAMGVVYATQKYGSIDYMCWGGDALPSYMQGYDINYMPQKKTGLISAFLLISKLFIKMGLNTSGYDVIYVQGAQQTPFLFWLPMFKGKKRIIYHTQDFLEPRRHRFYERFERWFTRHSDYVICNEVNRGRFMKSYYGLANMPAIVRTALPAWWNIPERKSAFRKDILSRSGVQDPESAVIIVAGGIYRHDRMSPQLLEAFAELPENYVIVFNGPPMAKGKHCRLDCEQHMKKLGLCSRVVFLGGLSFEELLTLYSIGEMGVLLYPNDGVGHYYQCPGRFSEYIRCGLSLISSDFPGLELLILKYKLGAVCDAEDASSIKEAILSVGNSAKSQRATIQKVAEDEFVYERHADILDAVFSGTYQSITPSVVT